MEFIFEYGLFLAKLITVALVILGAGSILFFFMRSKDLHIDHLKIEHLNKKYEDMSLMLNAHIMQKRDFKRVCERKKAA